MKPYRVKHKASGLYYQPRSNGNSLSKTGKVYMSGRDVLEGTDTFVFISFNKRCRLCKEYLKYFPTLESFHIYMVGRVPKDEFEKEEL